MHETGNNQGRAASILGLSRVTLRAKLRELHMPTGRALAPGGTSLID
jgi:DNA-binding NtrC family response regulator